MHRYNNYVYCECGVEALLDAPVKAHTPQGHDREALSANEHYEHELDFESVHEHRRAALPQDGDDDDERYAQMRNSNAQRVKASS